MRKESLAVSLALHVSLAGALALLSFTASEIRKPTKPTQQITRLTLPPPPVRAVRRTSLSDPGGGDRSPLPPSKGAPPRVEARVFIPPQIIRNERPQLVLQAGIDDVPKLNLPAGDPAGKSGIPSLGPGINGIGGWGNLGFGPGPGAPGPRGTASAAIPVKPTEGPKLIFKNEPEYSDTARKIRQQGTVILAVEVGADGRPHNIRIVRGLGAGLDEKAIDAVNGWRFRPAMANGRPVAVPITIEVNFRLL